MDYDGHREIFGGDDVQENLEEMHDNVMEVDDEVFPEDLWLPDEVYKVEKMANIPLNGFRETLDEEADENGDDWSEVNGDDWDPAMSGSEDGDDKELCVSDEEGNKF